MNLKIFASNLKMHASLYRYRYLDVNKFNLINDQSSDFNYCKYNTKHHIDKPSDLKIKIYNWK